MSETLDLDWAVLEPPEPGDVVLDLDWRVEPFGPFDLTLSLGWAVEEPAGPPATIFNWTGVDWYASVERVWTGTDWYPALT